MKQIAVCLSGCSRSFSEVFDKNQEFWDKFKTRVLKDKGSRISYFLSYWDFNVPGGCLLDSYHDRLISEGGWTEEDFDDKNRNAKKFEFLDKDTLEGISHLYNPVEAALYSWDEYIRQTSISRNRTKKVDELWWESPAFLMRESVRLKRKWELMYGFTFDVVFWSRFDTQLELDDQFSFDLNKLNIINRYTADAGTHLTGAADTFFFGKSSCVDLAADLYPAGNLPFDYPLVEERGGYTIIEQVFKDALDYDYVPCHIAKGIWDNLIRTHDEEYCLSFLQPTKLV